MQSIQSQLTMQNSSEMRFVIFSLLSSHFFYDRWLFFYLIIDVASHGSMRTQKLILCNADFNK